jgi:outer membrane biosynthesis protein TonB
MAAAAAVAAAAATAAPKPAEPVEPVAEQLPKKPTWTPVDESWLQPTPAPPAPRPPEPVQPPTPPPTAVEAPAAPAKPPAPVAKPRAKAAGPADALTRARQHLADGEFDKASKDYSTVIKKKYELDTVISDLRMAAEHFPTEPALWQLLGDAYMRADRLDEAVDAYNKGIQAT